MQSLLGEERTLTFLLLPLQTCQYIFGLTELFGSFAYWKCSSTSSTGRVGYTYSLSRTNNDDTETILEQIYENE